MQRLAQHRSLHSTNKEHSKYVCAQSHHSCLTLCDPMDYSPPSSSVQGILQAKYWSELPCPPPGDLPDPGIEPSSLNSPVLPGRFFTTSTTWGALRCVHATINVCTTVYLKGNENLTLTF